VTLQFEKHFTLEEARALVPYVRQQFRRLEEIRTKLGLSPEQMQELTRSAGGNGGGKKSAEYLENILKANSIIQEMLDRGILVKDVSSGLVDFPHLRDGREVFLCYHVGEETVMYYHELDAGYAGRRPV
jgi:hypothetical protein